MATVSSVLNRRSAIEPAPADSEVSLYDLLTDLYRRQRVLDPENEYLTEHARPKSVATQVRVFNWYARYIVPDGMVLDWGCNHAPDCCLLRARFGNRLKLHACDFVEPDRYPVLFDYARPAYTKLTDNTLLPYPEHTFDVVIGSGVLEHAVMDYESLKQLHRVLKPEGILVLTYLPNWLSLGEWCMRVIRGHNFHYRLYGLGETRQLLKRAGFYPLEGGQQSFFWERSLEALGVRRWQRPLTRLLSSLVPIHVFTSTHRFVARRMTMM
jgi:SAM-dependent methyltransferase